MSKWRPVMLFQIDVKKIGVYAAIGAVFTIFALMVNKCGSATDPEIGYLPGKYEIARANMGKDKQLGTILYNSTVPIVAKWFVRYKMITNEWHTNGYVDISFIELQQAGWKAWWNVIHCDPGGLTSIGLRDGDFSNTLSNQYFREAYRTAEAIICAFHTIDPKVVIDLVGDEYWVDPHRIVLSKHRMINRWRASSN